MTHFVYYCVTRLCREYHREFRTTLSPTEVRAATGRPVTCAGCGQPVRLLRTERKAA